MNDQRRYRHEVADYAGKDGLDAHLGMNCVHVHVRKAHSTPAPRSKGVLHEIQLREDVSGEDRYLDMSLDISDCENDLCGNFKRELRVKERAGRNKEKTPVKGSKFFSQ